MTILLFCSAGMLTLLIGVRHYEFVRGQGRFFELERVMLDRSTNRVYKKFSRILQRSLKYAHRDVILSGLHMVTYVALVLVRFVEGRLERITRFLRSFKTGKKRVYAVSTLKSIHRKKEHVSIDEEKSTIS